MKAKCFILIAAFLICGVVAASAETICIFKGSIYCQRKSLELNVSFPDGGSLFFAASEENPQAVNFTLVPEDLTLLLLKITTEITGTARVIERADSTSVIHGVIEPSKEALSSGVLLNSVRGSFEIDNDKIFLRQCALRGLEVQGHFQFVPPYDVDLTLALNNVLLADVFVWLGQKKIYAQGDISGKIFLLGFLDRLGIKGNLRSAGQVDKFMYDEISARFEGVYPIVKLLETAVTARDGMSFNIEGPLDLSKDFKDFSGQLAKMTVLPLIHETDVDRKWTLRRSDDGRTQGETEFRYRLRKEREISGVEEQGTVTIQRSIKF